MEVVGSLCGVIWCRNRRLPGVSSGKRYPTRPKHLANVSGKRWLTNQLQESKMVEDGVKVQSIEMNDIGEPGLMSDIKVLNLMYSDGDEQHETRPTQVLAKFAPTSFKTRVTTDLLKFGENEYRFYTQLLPALGGPDNFPGARPPACYGGDYNATSKNFVLLMEYLKDAEFPDQMGPELPISELQRIVRALARLHAPWLGTGCPDIEWAPRMDQNIVKLAAGELKRHWPTAVRLSKISKKAAKKNEDQSQTWSFEMPDSMLKMMPKLAPKLFKFTVHVARNCKNFETLQHGDTRLDNFFFINKKGGDGAEPDGEAQADSEREIGLIDWQLVNVGIVHSDLSYFLAGACKSDTILSHEPVIVEAYLDELQKGAPEACKNFTTAEWEECFNLAIIGQACKIIIGIGGVNVADVRALKVLDMIAVNTFKLWEQRNCGETVRKYFRKELISQKKLVAAKSKGKVGQQVVAVAPQIDA